VPQPLHRPVPQPPAHMRPQVCCCSHSCIWSGSTLRAKHNSCPRHMCYAGYKGWMVVCMAWVAGWGGLVHLCLPHAHWVVLKMLGSLDSSCSQPCASPVLNLPHGSPPIHIHQPHHAHTCAARSASRARRASYSADSSSAAVEWSASSSATTWGQRVHTLGAQAGAV
jgi:hypothetical protein